KQSADGPDDCDQRLLAQVRAHLRTDVLGGKQHERTGEAVRLQPRLDGRGNVRQPVEIRRGTEDPGRGAVSDDPLRDLSVVVRGNDVRPSGDVIRVRRRQAAAERISPFAVQVELRGGGAGRGETRPQRVLHVVGNVPSFPLLLLDADQNLVFRRIFVALDAGVAEVRGVENLPQVVEIGTL